MTRIAQGMPRAVIRPSRNLYVIDGELVRGWDLTTDPDTKEQLRTGYRCLRCYHVQSQPFPKMCEAGVARDSGELLCDYPMRAQQAADFEREYIGETPLWPNRKDEE